MGLENAKSVATLGTADVEVTESDRESAPDLSAADATAYRGLAARLNYLALDRPDLQFTAKEISKFMAKPKEPDWARFKRVAKYLIGKPRYVHLYLRQEMPDEVSACADSDWAGGRISRKSTSGGTLSLGNHLIKSWASTQPVIALSSGEAELYALVKAATQAAGMLSMLADYGFQAKAVAYTDATAANRRRAQKGPWETQAHQHPVSVDTRKGPQQGNESTQGGHKRKPCGPVDKTPEV